MDDAPILDRPITRANIIVRAGRELASRLCANESVSWPALKSAMRDASGGSDADGRWTGRDAYDALELAQTLAIVARTPATAATAHDNVTWAARLGATLPTQSRRTLDQIARQQFSTPIDLACITGLAAAVTATDVVLEPSAGTGLLAAWASSATRLFLNETDPTRRACLAEAFPDATVTAADGATINNRDESDRPTVVIMNPPFSASSELGRDRHTATRHLLAALRSCVDGGRAVAIMPGWFEPDGRHAQGYAMATSLGRLLLDTRIDGRLYAKHGTHVATRLMVYERSAIDVETARGTARSIEDLVEAVLGVPARAAAKAISAAPSAPPITTTRAPSLFRLAHKSTPMPRIQRTPAQHAETVEYRPLAEGSPVGEQIGLYLPYRPSRIAFADARPHPTALVESIAMSSIDAPIPTSHPMLPGGTIARGGLSEAQLETLVYATTAHEQDLPGTYVPDAGGIALKASEAVADDAILATTQTYRTGFFLGDGTGAGKGRQVAALFMDQWLRGHRSHIWISKTDTLIEDARRDWAALGGLPLDIQPLGRWKLDERVSMGEGIVFTTYATLRSERATASRLRQLLDWCGPATPTGVVGEFAGVVAFDEAHEMANAAGGESSRGKTKGSDQGIAGLKLQNFLPRARVIYVSATGASDINNLAYAGRLNLWGPWTAFANREKFVTSIRDGGVAAMELVARDLKAQGLYLARALSFAGVEYDALEHELSPGQIRDYDAYADAWAIIHAHMEDALEATGVIDAITKATLNSGAKAAARSVFEGTKQRFFGQLLLSAKLPSLLPAIRQDLADGRSVVVQLVSTAEAILDRRLASLEPGEAEDLAIDLSPREYMIDYLQSAFPTVQMEIYTDPDGYLRSRPKRDTEGNPVVNASAVTARERLVSELCSMPPIGTALDTLIDAFGTKHVAEVTGRSRRLLTLPDGSQKLERRPASSNLAETRAFMDGEKRLLVFSNAGGTGRSYHASLVERNQQRRIHYLLEPGWRADAAIQGLGRTHRSAQASAPTFRPVTTDCRGERRFISTIARRLDSLGALTRGQRQTGGQNMFDPADNLESSYGKAALQEWYHLLWRGKLSSVGLAAFERMTGLELTERDSGTLKEQLPPIQRWLNRLLALRIGVQNAIFDEFLGLIERRVAAAREAGTLDIGVETVAVERFTIADDKVIRIDSRSGAKSHLLTIDVDRKIPFVSLEKALRSHGDKGRTLLVNGRSGKAAIRTEGRAHTGEDGRPIAIYQLDRPSRRDWLRHEAFGESHWKITDRQSFAEAWAAECAEIEAGFHHERLYFATGLLLPIWDRLPDKPVSVKRLVDGQGSSILGREIPASEVPAFAKALGIDVDATIPTDDLVSNVLRSGKPLPFSAVDQLTVKRATIGSIQRLELVGYDRERRDWYEAQGCFFEVIRYKTRLFVPVDRAAAILDGLRPRT